MPTIGLREEFELQTRSQYTKVKCEIGFRVEGNELPSMAVLGEALEAGMKVIQDSVKASYTKVPARVPEVASATVT